MKKKWLAVLLAAATLVSDLPVGTVTVFADETEMESVSGEEETAEAVFADAEDVFTDTEEASENTTQEPDVVEEIPEDPVAAEEAAEEMTAAGEASEEAAAAEKTISTQDEIIVEAADVSEEENAADVQDSEETEVFFSGDETAAAETSAVGASAAVASGTCGDNATWTLTGTKKSGYTLTISGSGAIGDYPSYVLVSGEYFAVGSMAPWKDYVANIREISVGEKITYIGEYAFKCCSSLTSVIIPDSVTGIGEYAFCACSSLTSITIPGSVTSIGDGAFEYCDSLESITIPDSVTSIGDRAFSLCSSLKSIAIPSSVTKIGDSLFDDCSALTTIYYQGTAKEWKALAGKLDYGNAVVYYKSYVPTSSKTKGSGSSTVSNPTLTVNVSGTLPLKTKQKVTNLVVTMAKGDSVESWKSSNTEIVKVNGKSDGTCTLTAQKKIGMAKITIKLASGLSKKITVKVQKTAVATKSIGCVSSELTLKKGKSQKLSVTLKPISSTDKITYTTSNKKVATVSKKGVIKAKKKGTATITIKAGKKTKKIKVTVE